MENFNKRNFLSTRLKNKLRSKHAEKIIKKCGSKCTQDIASWKFYCSIFQGSPTHYNIDLHATKNKLWHSNKYEEKSQV
jgi:hypothetical protein